jgi:DMATS type aromatic prenyltransferase
LVFDAVSQLPWDNEMLTPALSIVESYILRCSPEMTRVEGISIDCVDPMRARIKIYIRSAFTAFSKICDMYTLGGRLKDKVTNAGIGILQELWPLVMDLPEECSDDQELQSCGHRTGGTIFNFEIKPGNPFPEPKIYIPVKHYGKNDIAIAEGIVEFCRRQGWNELANSYIDTIRSVLYVNPTLCFSL